VAAAAVEEAVVVEEEQAGRKWHAASAFFIPSDHDTVTKPLRAARALACEVSQREWSTAGVKSYTLHPTPYNLNPKKHSRPQQPTP